MTDPNTRTAPALGRAAILIAILGVLGSAAAPAAQGIVTAAQPGQAHHAATAVRVSPGTRAKPASLPKPAKHRVIVSPYARAAAAQARRAQGATAHAPTMVQGMGRPHRPHGAGGRQ